jgi:uncharacterized Zn finger protein
MRPGTVGPAWCHVCRQDVPHEVIESVLRGRVFWRCCGCGTVMNTPKPEAPRP